jgi:hypothetical protein
MEYQGIIIEESLEDKAVLKKLTTLKTKVEPVTLEHKTPWIKTWTMHTVAFDETQATNLCNEISHAIDKAHKGAWYADFKNLTHHYIVFSEKVFGVSQTDQDAYERAKEYGRSIGIPEYQLDFLP